MTRVFAYLRVSTASQIAGDGWPRQEAACRSLATAKGWTIARVFKEQQTGSDEFTEREHLSQAISMCNPVTGVGIIVVERADRIARDLCVSELFFRECRRRGIKVYAADSGEELVNAESDPTRILIRQILGALAQWEKTMLVRKLQGGRARVKSETGMQCGGTLPYGFRPNEWNVVRVVLRMNRQGCPLSVIERRLRKMTRRLPNKFPLPVSSPGLRRSTWWNLGTIQRMIKWWGPRVVWEKHLLGRELPDIIKKHQRPT